MANSAPFSDCRDAEMVESIFGSVSEFARLCEENQDNFSFGNMRVEYNPDSDIHHFYSN